MPTPNATARQLAHRYFFALLPDEVTGRRIHAFAERELGGKGLMRPERLHVTLALTADFDAPYPALAAALRRAGDAVAAAPVPLVLDRLSAGQRTAALRPAHDIPALRALQAEIARAMAREGVPMRRDWRFSPHVTLAYRDGEPVQRRSEDFGWTARDFVLIESLVGLTRHCLLARWPLEPARDPQGRLFS